MTVMQVCTVRMLVLLAFVRVPMAVLTDDRGDMKVLVVPVVVPMRVLVVHRLVPMPMLVPLCGMKVDRDTEQRAGRHDRDGVLSVS
jgi:hypothetical protein